MRPPPGSLHAATIVRDRTFRSAVAVAKAAIFRCSASTLSPAHGRQKASSNSGSQVWPTRRKMVEGTAILAITWVASLRGKQAVFDQSLLPRAWLDDGVKNLLMPCIPDVRGNKSKRCDAAKHCAVTQVQKPAKGHVVLRLFNHLAIGQVVLILQELQLQQQHWLQRQRGPSFIGRNRVVAIRSRHRWKSTTCLTSRR